MFAKALKERIVRMHFSSLSTGLLIMSISIVNFLDSVGIADGVGGYSELDIDSGDFSRQLMAKVHNVVTQKLFWPVYPSRRLFLIASESFYQSCYVLKTID